MDAEKKSLFQRIRSAKQSLENAEKSFQDDRGMRGELDLMLAEAELKNLRNKQSVPWSWNRHFLAMSVAMLLFVAGLGGWLFAKEDVHRAEALPRPEVMAPHQNVKSAATDVVAAETDGQDIGIKEKEASKLQLSDNDMRRLVRSARSELSSGK